MKDPGPKKVLTNFLATQTELAVLFPLWVSIRNLRNISCAKRNIFNPVKFTGLKPLKYWEFINKNFQYLSNNHPILD